MNPRRNNCQDLRRGIFHSSSAYARVGSHVLTMNRDAQNTARDSIVVATTNPRRYPEQGSIVAESGYRGYAICDQRYWPFPTCQYASKTGTDGIAIASNEARASAEGGNGSLLIFPYRAYLATHYKVVTVGEEGILPDTPYMLDRQTHSVVPWSGA